MKIAIENSSEVVEIKMIDPKSGMEWSADFVGNSVQQGDYSEPSDEQIDSDIVMVMSEEDAKWWESHCESYQSADETLFAKREEVRKSDEHGECDEFDEAFHQIINGVEFEDQPSAMVRFCEEWNA